MTSLTLLSDVMLKKLMCSTCDKYLSVLPIKVYPNRVIKCGRCCAENDGGIDSIYNSLAKNCVFKCVNRYERCNKLLTVSEVVEHEKQCISDTYRCPKCDYKFSGSAHQLVLHYSRQHPRSILKNYAFSIKVKRNFREQYLLLVEDNIFFVLVDNLANENVLYLSAVSLISCRNVKHWFSVRPIQKPKAITTEVKPCHSLLHFECDYFHVKTNSMTEVSCRVHLDLSEHVNVVRQIRLQRNTELSNPKIDPVSKTDEETEPQPQEIPSTSMEQEISSASIESQTASAKDVLGAILTDEFKKEYPGYELTPCGTALFKGDKRIELACSNCKQLTGCNVFNCQLSRHIVCWDCKAWCGICNTSINGWNVTLANINELLMLPCRWQCGRHFLGNHIAQHELCCAKSGFRCPVCSSGNFNLEQLCSHLASAHSNYKDAAQFNLTGYLKECGLQTSGEVYFFHNGYWITMCWKKSGTVYEGVIFGDHTELYELAVICNTNKKYNKIDNGVIKFELADNPRFYMKRIRNV